MEVDVVIDEAFNHPTSNHAVGHSTQLVQAPIVELEGEITPVDAEETFLRPAARVIGRFLSLETSEDLVNESQFLIDEGEAVLQTTLNEAGDVLSNTPYLGIEDVVARLPNISLEDWQEFVGEDDANLHGVAVDGIQTGGVGVDEVLPGLLDKDLKKVEANKTSQRLESPDEAPVIEAFELPNAFAGQKGEDRMRHMSKLFRGVLDNHPKKLDFGLKVLSLCSSKIPSLTPLAVLAVFLAPGDLDGDESDFGFQLREFRTQPAPIDDQKAWSASGGEEVREFVAK
ncbi:hypothetical protein HDV05_005238, partial [Chytridiales sp. JEL 0842]